MRAHRSMQSTCKGRLVILVYKRVTQGGLEVVSPDEKARISGGGSMKYSDSMIAYMVSEKERSVAEGVVLGEVLTVCTIFLYFQLWYIAKQYEKRGLDGKTTRMILNNHVCLVAGCGLHAVRLFVDRIVHTEEKLERPSWLQVCLAFVAPVLVRISLCTSLFALRKTLRDVQETSLRPQAKKTLLVLKVLYGYWCLRPLFVLGRYAILQIEKSARVLLIGPNTVRGAYFEEIFQIFESDLITAMSMAVFLIFDCTPVALSCGAFLGTIVAVLKKSNDVMRLYERVDLYDVTDCWLYGFSAETGQSVLLLIAFICLSFRWNHFAMEYEVDDLQRELNEKRDLSMG